MLGGGSSGSSLPEIKPEVVLPKQAKSWVEDPGARSAWPWGVPGRRNGWSPPWSQPGATIHRPCPQTGSARQGRPPRGWSQERLPRRRLVSSTLFPSAAPPRAAASPARRDGSRSARGRHPPQRDVPRQAERRSGACAPASADAGNRPTDSRKATLPRWPRRARQRRRSSPRSASHHQRHTARPTGCRAPPVRARMGSGPEGRACSAPSDAPSSLPPPVEIAGPSYGGGSDRRRGGMIRRLWRRRNAMAAPGEAPPARPAHTPLWQKHACLLPLAVPNSSCAGRGPQSPVSHEDEATTQ